LYNYVAIGTIVKNNWRTYKQERRFKENILNFLKFISISILIVIKS